MQYILNETEFQAFQNLKEKNAKLISDLAFANAVCEKDRVQINNLNGLVAQGKQSIKERDQRIVDLKHARDLDNKKLAEQAHELLVKEAELADLSSKNRSMTNDIEWYQRELGRLQKDLGIKDEALREAKRDCEGTSARLAETEKISAARLDTMNYLQAENRRLRAEHVCVAQNPKTGTVRVVSVVKADTYRKFGWIVSEEYLVDRPA